MRTMMDKTKIEAGSEYFERRAIDLLDQIIQNQEEQRATFEEFKEEVLEKLDNIGTAGPDYSVLEP